MGLKKYRGPIVTVADAISAHRTITITCQRCSRYRIMWAYKIYLAKKAAASLPLEKTVPGFWCKGCRRSVNVFMKVDGPRE